MPANHPDGIPHESLLLKWSMHPAGGAKAASPLWGHDADVAYRIHCPSDGGGWQATAGHRPVGGLAPDARTAAWGCSRHALAELIAIATSSPDPDERRRAARVLSRLAHAANKTLPVRGCVLGQIEKTRAIQTAAHRKEQQP